MIARKWRPKNFGEVVGQNHVAQTLQNALKSDRLPHALLFSGPRGVGKTSSARILAKSLRCTHTKSFVPCNTCTECEDIAASSHIDVIEIDGASNNGVDAIRELRETVGYMPSSGKYKIYIIDEVHMLSMSAFNALLKTLEEPPEHVIFIFATTEPQKIPLTVLSRCQRFDFQRIPTRDIVNHLSKICNQEEVKTTDEALWIIARQSDGAMRDSQSLLDQAITFSNGTLTPEKLESIFGLTHRDLLMRILKAFTERNETLALEAIEDLFKAGHSASQFIQDLLEELRHLLMIQLEPKALSQIVDLPDSEIDFLQSLSVHLTSEDIQSLFDMALKGAYDILKASNPHIVLEMLIIRMTRAPRIIEIEALLKKETTRPLKSLNQVTNIKPLKKNSSPPPPLRKSSTTPTPSGTDTISSKAQNPKDKNIKNPLNHKLSNKPQKTVQTNSTKSNTLQNNKELNLSKVNKINPSSLDTETFNTAENNLEDKWAKFIQMIKKHNAPMSAKLECATLTSIKGGRASIQLASNYKLLYEQMNQDKFINELRSLFQSLWGLDLKPIISLTDKPLKLSPKEKLEASNKQKIDNLRVEVENHPMVKKLKDTFNGKVQSIEDSE